MKFEKHDVILHKGKTYQVLQADADNLIGRLYRTDKQFIIPTSQAKKHPFFPNGIDFMKR
jgi:hypothetical protein